MIIPTLFLLRADPWLNLVVCAAFCALTLSRVQFAHPVSVREHRPISLGFMLAWLGSMTWLAIAQHDVRSVRVVLIVAPLWTVVQVVLRLRSNAAARCASL
jgi:phosphatidylserine synthase